MRVPTCQLHLSFDIGSCPFATQWPENPERPTKDFGRSSRRKIGEQTQLHANGWVPAFDAKLAAALSNILSGQI